MAFTTALIPTKTRSGATGKTPPKATTSELHVKKKKLRKMVLPTINDEEEEKRMNNLFLRRKKVVNKDALNIPTEDVQEGSRLISTSLLNKLMDKSFITDVLQKQVEVEVIGEAIKAPYVVGTLGMAEEAAT